MCTEKTPWEQVIEFHGHTCAEIALGFRVAQIAQRELGIRPTPESELIAESEILSCAIDAIQIINRCPVGRGALIINDQRNYQFKFHYTGTDTILKITVKPQMIEIINALLHIDHPRQRQNRTLEAIQILLTTAESDFCTLTTEKGTLSKRL